ncbi:hypothetical protein OPV22_014394 [Ensete ventricosum]|uniref:Uncharacterized protein n=1 Tax=Ensete ventricosum TaxID=4639 RepID=A0AAV8R9L7_ENSVE|nr:hypothetical protein OPV22_014394 [Ensete ventricosum]
MITLTLPQGRSVWCVHRWSALWDDGGVVQDAIVPPCYFLIRSRYLPFAALFSGRTLSSVAQLLTALLRSASQEDLQVLEVGGSQPNRVLASDSAPSRASLVQGFAVHERLEILDRGNVPNQEGFLKILIQSREHSSAVFP